VPAHPDHSSGLLILNDDASGGQNPSPTWNCTAATSAAKASTELLRRRDSVHFKLKRSHISYSLYLRDIELEIKPPFSTPCTDTCTRHGNQGNAASYQGTVCNASDNFFRLAVRNCNSADGKIRGDLRDVFVFVSRAGETRTVA
jgi:hypothetical protein